jgi:hypothetical protein
VTKASLELIIRTLNDANVRYLVVGGIAVNAHGYHRLTVDVDLLIHLDRSNLIAGLKALHELGYRTMIPVSIEDVADEAKRQAWIIQKQMKVLNLKSDSHRETDIDVFISDPLGFEEAYPRAHYFTIAPGLDVPVCSYGDLVKLKMLASRPQDLADLDQLRIARGETQ